ncbi:hypothetical protein KI387_027357, partial [Taxus chinensis]
GHAHQKQKVEQGPIPRQQGHSIRITWKNEKIIVVGECNSSLLATSAGYNLLGHQAS